MTNAALRHLLNEVQCQETDVGASASVRKVQIGSGARSAWAHDSNVIARAAAPTAGRFAMKFKACPMQVVAGVCAAMLFLSTTAALAQTQEGPPQRVIVKWKNNISLSARSSPAAAAVDQAGSRIGVSIRRVRTIATGAEVVDADRRLTRVEFDDLIRTLKTDPNVEYAEEDLLLHPFLTPDDTRYSEQWGYYETAAGLNLPPAWDITTGTGVTVAVLDTGYRPHADLAANIIGGYDFISDAFVSRDGDLRDSNAQDPGDWNSATDCAPAPASNSSWHGTHVAGTIAALTNNSSGVAGVAFGARVLPVRVLGRCGGLTSDIADAIIWAAGGTVAGVPANPNAARVINMSLGSSPGATCSSTEQAAINTARSLGAVVVVAAGNDNVNANLVTPANCSGVVVVAAVGRTGGKASYSNFGAIVDVAAPGGSNNGVAANNILSTLNAGTTSPTTDSYAFYAGTSMATPHVAGVTALMLSRNGALTPDEIETRLKGSTRAFPATCSQCGTGIVNALAAVNAATGGGGGGGSVLTNGVPVTGLSGATGAELRFTLTVPAGATNLQVRISGGTGDADLYVRFGSAPTTTTYTCRPFLSGNNETCTIAAPSVGTYHVMVRGFATFSGVSLVGSYTTGGSGSCAAGFTSFTGTLSSGASAFAPSTAGVSTAAGVHSGRLTGPASADFDLYLQRLSGTTWTAVAAAESSTSTESIDFTGTASTYRWRVLAFSGSGAYVLCVRTP